MYRPGLVITLLVLVVDQLSKWWLTGLLSAHPGGLRLAPFFNLVPVWNRGVSFGMFNSAAGDQRWWLIGLALLMVVALLIWLGRISRPYLAGAVGMIIGGALGNVVDRLRFGAVADFFDFHLAGWHWPAFNIADSAIVLGVAVLLIDSLFGGSERAKTTP